MRLALGVILVLGLLGSGATQAQQDRPVTIVVPYAPGGIVDLIARVVGAEAAKTLGNPVVVQNRPGASGVLGATFVSKSAPDGQTLLMASNSTMINKWTYKNLPYDPATDFAPVALVGTVTYVLIANPSVRATSVSELLAHARQKPNSLNYASFGKGSLAHLAGELLKRSGGVEMVHVPYKGSAPALQDLIGGQVQLMFDPIATALPPVRSNHLRALAVASMERSPLLPDVPTIAESGVAGFEVVPWYGFVAPAGTSRDVLQRLNAGISAALKTPEVVERLRQAGISVQTRTSEEFGKVMTAELTRWKDVVAQAGLASD